MCMLHSSQLHFLLLRNLAVAGHWTTMIDMSYNSSLRFHILLGSYGLSCPSQWEDDLSLPTQPGAG